MCDDPLRRAAQVARADEDPRWHPVADWLDAVHARLVATAHPDWHAAVEPHAYTVARALLKEAPNDADPLRRAARSAIDALGPHRLETVASPAVAYINHTRVHDGQGPLSMSEVGALLGAVALAVREYLVSEPCDHGVELDMCDTPVCAQKLNEILKEN